MFVGSSLSKKKKQNKQISHFPINFRTPILPTMSIIIISAAILFLLGLGGVMAPLRCKQLASEESLSLCNIFAGGVFCAMAIIHMLPEAIEGVGKKGYGICMGGFVGVGVIKMMLGGSHDHILRSPITTSNSKYSRLPIPVDDSSDDDDDKVSTDIRMSSPLSDTQRSVTAMEPKQSSASSVLLLCVALIVHSVVEGVGIGMSNTESGSILMAIATGLHKSIAGFALGSSLSQSSLERITAITLAITFASATPLGIFVGEIVNNSLPPVFDGVLKALAAGMFLFIASVEMLPPQFSPNRVSPWQKSITLVLGVGIVFVMSVALPEEEAS